VPLLCLAAAVEVAAAAGPSYQIKWPNDVLAPDGRKVAGILAELETAGGCLSHVIVGIGINLVSAPPLPTATSLVAVDGGGRDPEVVGRQVAEGLLRASRQLERDPQPILKAWRLHAHTLGRHVDVGGVRGLAVDIDTDGALLVRTKDGERRVLAGDVTMVAQRLG
jgi:BirA family biotin operon repressor/biotin-[acetyl-CoA-carboxylase] ligase